MFRPLPIVVLLVGVALQAAPAEAQRRLTGGVEGSGARPVPHLDRIGVDERLDQQMPLDAPFRDHEGREVSLRDYVDGERPVLLTFAYHTCPSLCSLVLDAAKNAVKETEWTPGDEYQVVTISIDPDETVQAAGEKRREVLSELGRDGADWHFLVGSQDAIQRVTAAAGYRYFYDEAQEQYAHPAAFMFLTPDGKLARYLYGLRMDRSDVRLALLEASEGRSISTGERILLYCYAYDPEANSYTLMAWNVMKIGGGLTALAMGFFLFVLWRRERRRGGLLENDSDVPTERGDPSSGSASLREPKQVEA